MAKLQVGIIMGSQSDWTTMREAADILDELKVSYEAKIVSAHRTPDRLWDYGKTAAKRGLKVIIAGAGQMRAGIAAMAGDHRVARRRPLGGVEADAGEIGDKPVGSGIAFRLVSRVGGDRRDAEKLQQAVDGGGQIGVDTREDRIETAVGHGGLLMRFGGDPRAIPREIELTILRRHGAAGAASRQAPACG